MELMKEEVVIIISRDLLVPFRYYYRGEAIGIETHSDPTMNEEELNELIKEVEGKKGYWLILSHAYKTRGIYWNYFEANKTLVEYRSLIDIEIYHYI